MKFHVSVFQENKSLKSTSRSSLKSSGSKVFAYSVSSKKSTPDPEPNMSSDNTESAKFLALTDSVHEVEAHFAMNDKKLVQDRRSEFELREKFKNLMIAFEEEKHSKDKLKIKRDKMRAQLKETTEALLEAQFENDELIKQLREEEAQKQFLQVESTTLKDEIELLKRKLYVFESLEKERKEQVEEADKDSTGLLQLESQLSTESDQMSYKTLYEGMTTRHQEMEGVMTGTIERMKMELSDLKLENLGLQTKNSELSDKLQLLEPKWKEKSKELDNINEMIEALNLQIAAVHDKCNQGLCVSGRKLEQELKDKDEIMATLQSQLSKSKMKRKEMNTTMVAMEKQISEMEGSKIKADEKFLELVKEAEQLKCRLVDKDELCNSGACPNGMKFVSKDSETKYIVQKGEDTINTLNAKVEKLTAKKDDLRKELAVYKMEMINNENISKETEKLNRRLEKELVNLKEEITVMRKRCEDGTCRTGSAKESELLVELRAELRDKERDYKLLEEDLSNKTRRVLEMSKERDELKMKATDLEAMLEKSKTHSRLLTNETVSLNTQLADMERKLEVETSRREDSERRENEDKENRENEKELVGELEQEGKEKLPLPISRTSSQVSSLSSLLEQADVDTRPEEKQSEVSQELTEARKKIARQKDKIKNLKTEYLNLKDLVSTTNAQIYDIMSDEKTCVRPSCKELRHKVDKSLTEIDLLKSKLEHVEMKNVDFNLELNTSTDKLTRKREDYRSLQELLRTTLENCKELERKVKSQQAALEVAKLKGWGVEHTSDIQENRQFYYKQADQLPSEHHYNHADKNVDFDTGVGVRTRPNAGQNRAPVQRTRSRNMKSLMANFEK